MRICTRCEDEFDLSSAKRSLGRSYYAGVYDDYYPDGDVCKECAIEEISADYATGAETSELMGTSWYDD